MDEIKADFADTNTKIDTEADIITKFIDTFDDIFNMEEKQVRKFGPRRFGGLLCFFAFSQ